jgi:hypothetical protein
MNKTQYQQHYKRNGNNINYKDYNNNYYNNNYYHNFNHKKNYVNNTNNYNEERKKNNYYNNKINDFNEYNNKYDDYNEYDNYNEYNEYNDGYNYIYPSSNKKKKVYNRYNNYYENNGEVMNKTLNEKRIKKEVMKVKINISDNKYKELIIYKGDEVEEVVKKFCNDNFIDAKLEIPLCNKIKQSLNQIDLITNKVKLSRDSVLMLEKAKNFIQNK